MARCQKKCLSGERLWEDIQCTGDKPKHSNRDQEGRVEKSFGHDNPCYRPSYAGDNNVSPQTAYNYRDLAYTQQLL